MHHPALAPDRSGDPAPDPGRARPPARQATRARRPATPHRTATTSMYIRSPPAMLARMGSGLGQALPLHPDLSLVAERRRGFLRQADEAAAQTDLGQYDLKKL